MSGHVTLREFFERVIVEHEKRRDDLRSEDRRWLERELLSLAKALELQAKEMERRLDILNHAHEEARRVLGTYVPRELYEKAQAERGEWQHKSEVQFVAFEARLKSVELGIVNLPGGVKSLELGLATQAGQSTAASATTSRAITIGAVVVSAVIAAVALLNYFGK